MRRCAQPPKPDRVPVLQRYFRTEPGGYGEGDVFLGVRVPAVRRIARAGMTLEDALTLLRSDVHEERLLALIVMARRAERGDRAVLQRYFRTEPGGYGEGDVFLGVRVPAVRRIARAGMTLEDALTLLQSDVHEERLLALIVMARRAERGDRAVLPAYLAHSQRVNNWDLVDVSAPAIVGGALLAGEPRVLLDRLAASPSVWERRIALLATQRLIRAGELDDTYRLAERLLADPHDLIHKAAGWMLREAGGRDEPRLLAFVERHHAAMPRTMLRYALEQVAPAERARLMRR